MAHTPGPWETDVNKHTEPYEDVLVRAAAPDLLEACQRLLVCMNLAGWENDDAAITARAAVAKATGGTR